MEKPSFKSPDLKNLLNILKNKSIKRIGAGAVTLAVLSGCSSGVNAEYDPTKIIEAETSDLTLAPGAHIRHDPDVIGDEAWGDQNTCFVNNDEWRTVTISHENVRSSDASGPWYPLLLMSNETPNDIRQACAGDADGAVFVSWLATSKHSQVGKG